MGSIHSTELAVTNQDGGLSDKTFALYQECNALMERDGYNEWSTGCNLEWGEATGQWDRAVNSIGEVGALVLLEHALGYTEARVAVRRSGSAEKAVKALGTKTQGETVISSPGSPPGAPASSQGQPKVIQHPEAKAPKPVRPADATSEWDRFLGSGSTSNINPYTGKIESDRLWSADGKRSIRYGKHEMDSTPTKHHYHQEEWKLDSVNNELHYQNTLVRVPNK